MAHPRETQIVSQILSAGPDAGFDAAAALDTLRHQNDLLRQTIVLCDRLTAMALRGAGIASITTQLSAMIGHAVTVFDPMLYPLASAQPRGAGGGPLPGVGAADEGGPEQLTSNPLGWTITHERLREALASARGPVRLPPVPGSPAASGCVVAPITVGDRLLGYAAVASPQEPLTGDLDLFAVQHAATVYAQALLEEDRVGAFRLRFKREIFESLLRGQDNSGAEALEAARLIGLEPDQPYQAVAIAAHDRVAPALPATPPTTTASRDHLDPSVQGQILDTVTTALGHRFPDLVTVRQDDELIVVAPPTLASPHPPGGDDGLAACLLVFLRGRFPATRFTIGASKVSTSLSALAAAREQARASRKMAQRLDRSNEVTAYDDLGFYRLLFAVPPAELQAFSDEVLGTVIAYDETHRSDFVATLAVYLQTGGSPRRAAERLFVHPNTVVYRIGRIQSLAAVDLSDPEDRLLCQAALKAREALEYRTHENRSAAAPRAGAPGPAPGDGDGDRR